MVDVSTMRSRLDRLRAACAAAEVSTLVIAPGSDLRYVTGIGGESHERLTALVVPADPGIAPAFVTPELEFAGMGDVPFESAGIEVRTWVDGQDPHRIAVGGMDLGRVAVSDMMTAMHALPLRDVGAGELVLGGDVIRELRMRKDPEELEELRAAGAAIDRVHARVHEWLRAGRTEAEVAADIEAAIIAEGHTRADFVIVGSGPNGASPHHGCSGRVIESGDVVVVDIGGPLPSGYGSDCTRTYAVGSPRDADVATAYAALQAAQQAAVDVVAPGVTCEAVDAAAREVLAGAGIADRFIHRTGHGIGLDGHEEPYIVAGNTLPLEAGMAFSVEPGVYFTGRWGARIEDIVAVTVDGVESFNTRPRELVIL